MADWQQPLYVDLAKLTGPWVMKRGALQPPYRGTLRHADKSPVDLADPDIDHVDFVVRQRRTLDPVVEAEATIIQVGDADTGTDVGVCEYDWQPGDTDQSGDYYGEFAVYDATGNVLVRIPNDAYQEIRILGNLSSPPPPATNPTPPQITAVTPSSGSAGGGEQLDVTGTGLLTVTAVRFSDTVTTLDASWFQANSDTDMTVVTPGWAGPASNTSLGALDSFGNATWVAFAYT